MTALSIRGMNWAMDEIQYIRDAQHGETLTLKEKIEIQLGVAEGLTKQAGFPSIVALGERMMLVRQLQLFFIELTQSRIARNSKSVISFVKGKRYE